MASKMRSMRLDDEVWSWLAEEGGRRGSSRTGVVEALVAAARSGGGVLPPPGPMAEPVSRAGRELRAGIRVDTPSQAAQWALDRQAKLNEAKYR